MASVIAEWFTAELLGKTPTQALCAIPARRRALSRHGGEELVARAASLLDVAAHDLWAQQLGCPVYQLLGAGRSEPQVPILRCVTPRQGESTEAFARRVAEDSAPNYRALKVTAPPDPADAECLLAALRDNLGYEIDLVVDGHWQWLTLEAAITCGRIADRYNITWLEDPFPRDFSFDYLRRLRDSISTPVGYGDEVFARDQIQALTAIDAVDVLRVCVSTMGGIGGCTIISERAAAAGTPVSPHVHPEISQHLAFALPNVRYIEMYPEGGAVDCSEQFLSERSQLRNHEGHVRRPLSPGLGLEIDWDAVSAHALAGPTSLL